MLKSLLPKFIFMKKLLMLLLPALLCFGLYGQVQQIKIVSFTVKNQLPAVIDSWNSTPGSLLLVAQMLPGVRIDGIRLVVQIKANGAIICGNNSTGGMLVDNFTTRTFSANELTGALIACKELKEGSYSICVQFFDGGRKEVSNEICKQFTVETPKATDYAPPTLISPENDKEFTEAELQRPVMFRWTPLIPKPQEPVTYRLRVWQLMQGQNGTQAMRTSQPIITKEVDNLTQTAVTGIYTGPCKPPYMCDFIWNVQALNREGKPIGRNEGTSEPWTFKVKQSGQTSVLVNTFPEDKKNISLEDVKKETVFKWTAIEPKQPTPVTYKLRVWQLMQGQNGTQAMRTNQPIITKDVDNLTQTIVTGAWTGPCKPPYMCDFIWNVQAVTRDGHIAATSEPTTFSLTEENKKCLVNFFPEDDKKLKLKEAKESVTFKWKQMTPGESVTYRLKVWQLMQGQTGAQAIKSNKPVITKEVKNGTETIVNGIYTGPCKPPYMCDFIWNVEEIARDGHTTCTSEPSTFKIASNDIDIQIDSVSVSCCGSNGLQNVYIKIKNNLSNSVKITNLNIDKVNGVTNIISISGLAPALPVNITGLGSQVFTGTIKCIDSAKTIRFFVRAEDALDNAITETEVETDTLKCPCDPCRTLGVTLKNDTLTTTAGTSGQILLSGMLSGLNPNNVKKITMELVYFNIVQTGDSNCVKCAENKEWGNFIKPSSSAFTGFGTGLLNGINFGREWTWMTTVQKECDSHGGGGVDHGGGVGNPNLKENCTTCGTGAPPPPPDDPNRNAGKITNTGPGIIIPNPNPIPKANTFSLPIAVPPGSSLKCCGDKITVCIRYTIWDFCCHACDVIRCYTIERKVQ
jgi:hypothetical protein